MRGTTRGAAPYGAERAARVHARRCGGGAECAIATPPSVGVGPDAGDAHDRATSQGFAAANARLARDAASRERDAMPSGWLRRAVASVAL